MLRNKRILVTGAGGFIGSHLVEGLLAHGCKHIKAFVHYNSNNHFGWLDEFSKADSDRLEIIPGDICDEGAVRAAVHNTDIIFHLAAMISIPQSFKMPQITFDINAKGTMNILTAANAEKCEKVLLASTSEVYGTLMNPPIKENHPLCARSPYSASKIAAEKIAESFYHSFETPVIMVRSFNTYGPRQSPRAIIPAVITQLLGQRQEIRVGTVDTTRDFVYVRDAVDAYIRLAQTDNMHGRAVNVATARETSIAEICRILIQAINPAAALIHDEQRLRPATSEVNRLVGDNQLLASCTGWTPAVSLESGLEQTIAWFKKNNPAHKDNHFYV